MTRAFAGWRPVGWVAAVVLVFTLLIAGNVSAAPGRPDIVLIMSDDMGFSDIGCYGGEIDTPVLDGLAAGGLRFTQFYNTARCCPTRASLMTGLYPHQAGVGHMMQDKGHDGYRGNLNRRCVTIAEVLKTAGYSTYMAGKWHVTKETSPDGPKFNWPLQRGYDKFYGTITGAGSFYDPGTLTRNNTMITPLNDPEYRPETYYYTTAISASAVRFITDHQTENPDKPLFLYVAYTCAHWPMHALPEDIRKYQGKYAQGYAAIRAARFERMRRLGLLREQWELSPAPGSWDDVEHKAWEARCMEVYAAMIDRMDHGIGRIVEALREAGRFDNTLIFFLQDNGGCAEGVGRQADKKPRRAAAPMGPNDLQLAVHPAHARDGRPMRHGPEAMPGADDTYIAYGKNWANVSNTPFREYKHWVHEGGIATPLIAHWPVGIKRAGELEHQPGHLIDIMATCVEVAGATYPAEFKGHKIQPMEGCSLVPAFRGESIGRKGPIYWEHEGNRAIRQGKWKLVAKGRTGPWELYDMETDRSEMHDLAGRHPERVKEMASAWEAYARRANVLPWPGPKKKK